MNPGDMAQWQQEHPTAARIFKPCGFFKVFHSWPFLSTIVLLALNTLACTVLHLGRWGGLSALKGPGALERWGFVALHLSLLVLFAGGFLSSATSLEGQVVLTEGQSFTEEHDNYLYVVEGPLRSERHKGFVATLKEVSVRYEQDMYMVDVASKVEIRQDGEIVAADLIRINRPLTYEGMTFTQDKAGFSPRLTIRRKGTNELLVDSFVALETFKTDEGREYRDFLLLPFIEHRIIITLYPSFSIDDSGEPIKTSEEPNEPLLFIKMEDKEGNVVSRGYVIAEGKTTVGDYSFEFPELRRWAAFKIVEDPGYRLVWVAMWLGLGALLLKYAPVLRTWFAEETAGRDEPNDNEKPDSAESET